MTIFIIYTIVQYRQKQFYNNKCHDLVNARGTRKCLLVSVIDGCYRRIMQTIIQTWDLQCKTIFDCMKSEASKIWKRIGACSVSAL